MKRSRDGEKVKKQNGMSTIIVNYSEEINNFLPTLHYAANNLPVLCIYCQLKYYLL